MSAGQFTHNMFEIGLLVSATHKLASLPVSPVSKWHHHSFTCLAKNLRITCDSFLIPDCISSSYLRSGIKIYPYQTMSHPLALLLWCRILLFLALHSLLSIPQAEWSFKPQCLCITFRINFRIPAWTCKVLYDLTPAYFYITYCFSPPCSFHFDHTGPAVLYKLIAISRPFHLFPPPSLFSHIFAWPFSFLLRYHFLRRPTLTKTIISSHLSFTFLPHTWR